MEVNEGNSSDKIYYEEQISESYLNEISLSDTPKLSSLMLSLMLENGWHASLPLKVFHTKSHGEILVRGEGYNTLGVCHQLSSGLSSNLNLRNTPLLAYWPILDIYLSNVEGTSFMCLTSISTHMDDWKSFMEFGIEKSHEMISYNLSWIALLSEWNYRSSTKPCYLVQVNLIELYNKSHEGFMLSRDQENASIGLKLRFKLYCDATLTCVDQTLTVLAWSCILKKSWSLSGVEQNLFLNQEPDQLVSKSNRALKLESMPVLGARNFA